jgi:hypothetical protein
LLVDLVLSAVALLVPDTIGCFDALVEVPCLKRLVLMNLHFARKVSQTHVEVVHEDLEVVSLVQNLVDMRDQQPLVVPGHCPKFVYLFLCCTWLPSTPEILHRHP